VRWCQPRANLAGGTEQTEADPRRPRVRQAKSAKDTAQPNAAHRLPQNEPAGRRRACVGRFGIRALGAGRDEGGRVLLCARRPFEAQAKLPFERPPVTAKGSRIVLSRADKPMPGAIVALDAPDCLKIELPSDAAGMIETGIAYPGGQPLVATAKENGLISLPDGVAQTAHRITMTLYVAY